MVMVAGNSAVTHIEAELAAIEAGLDQNRIYLEAVLDRVYSHSEDGKLQQLYLAHPFHSADLRASSRFNDIMPAELVALLPRENVANSEQRFQSLVSHNELSEAQQLPLRVAAKMAFHALDLIEVSYLSHDGFARQKPNLEMVGGVVQWSSILEGTCQTYTGIGFCEGNLVRLALLSADAAAAISDPRRIEHVIDILRNIVFGAPLDSASRVSPLAGLKHDSLTPTLAEVIHDLAGFALSKPRRMHAVDRIQTIYSLVVGEIRSSILLNQGGAAAELRELCEMAAEAFLPIDGDLGWTPPVRTSHSGAKPSTQVWNLPNGKRFWPRGVPAPAGLGQNLPAGSNQRSTGDSRPSR